VCALAEGQLYSAIVQLAMNPMKHAAAVSCTVSFVDMLAAGHTAGDFKYCHCYCLLRTPHYVLQEHG
jgi:hypothetical protein